MTNAGCNETKEVLAMPVTLYTEDEVEFYTKVLAKAYRMLRDEPEPATEDQRRAMLKEIERTLGWKGPPPFTAPPPADLAGNPAKGFGGTLPA